jgi:hypothetical protein
VGGKVITIRKIILWAVLGLVMGRPTIKAPTDTTTDDTTEFVSSTSGKTWWTEEGLIRQGHPAEIFVSLNYDNLLQDISKGEGGIPFHLWRHSSGSCHLSICICCSYYSNILLIYPNIQIQNSDADVTQFLHQVNGVMTNPFVLPSKNSLSLIFLSVFLISMPTQMEKQLFFALSTYPNLSFGRNHRKP